MVCDRWSGVGGFASSYYFYTRPDCAEKWLLHQTVQMEIVA